MYRSACATSPSQNASMTRSSHRSAIACLSEDDASLGYGGDAVALWINAAGRPVPPHEESGLHFCFNAPTRDGVDAFHAAALRTEDATTVRPASAPTTVRTTTLPS